MLSQSSGQVAHVILTRSPLNLPEQAPWIPFDLHVLSTPPAFILSQNQTLHQDFSRTEVLYESESQMKDSNFHLTTTKSTGWTRCLLLTSFDERRDRLDPFIAARTGFWLSFFRFQGATTHTSELGGVKYTISGFLRRICGWVTPATGMPTLSARSAEVQIHRLPSLRWEDHCNTHDPTAYAFSRGSLAAVTVRLSQSCLHYASPIPRNRDICHD